MSRWFRVAHLKFKPLVKVGDYVTPETTIGYVGSTGKSTGPHVHLDGTLGKPSKWTMYRMNYPIEKLASIYFDTEPWAKIVLPYPRRYLTNRHLIANHIGVDVNVAPQDDGLPVKSPCFGRVQYVEPPITIYRVLNGVRRLIQPTWGGGFGNFLWIEKDETKRENI